MPADPDCLFCRIVAGEVPSTRVHEDEATVAFMDIAPATDGHVLVVPRDHAADIADIDPEALAACARTAQVIARRAFDALGAEGVNLLNSSREAAWQTVGHFHLHVIPRYAGDPLKLPWAPAAGDDERIAAAARALSARGSAS